MEDFKIVNYKDTKDLIKMFCRGDVEDKKKYWIDSIAQSIKFEYDNYTPEMIIEYNELIEYLQVNLPDMEINKSSRETLEKVLENKREIKNKSSYTATQAKAIKKYRQSLKGKEKNNELSKKYYEERKDIPEIKEKVKQAHKTSYAKLKEDPERYKLYLERKKELYHLRKSHDAQLIEIMEAEAKEIEENIINPIID
jgi:tRNA nucleotidyltransferase/poly(A) polymerase